MNPVHTSPLDEASSSIQPPHFSAGINDAQSERLKQQFALGELSGLRKYLAASRQAHEWQDRVLILNHLAPAIPLDVLETACAIEPEAADLAIVRCAYYSALALQYRGTGPREELPVGGLHQIGASVRNAMISLEKSARLDPEDPTPFACIYRCLGIFDQLKSAMQQAFQQATTLAPGLAPFLIAAELPPAQISRLN